MNNENTHFLGPGPEHGRSLGRLLAHAPAMAERAGRPGGLQDVDHEEGQGNCGAALPALPGGSQVPRLRQWGDLPLSSL